MGRHSASCELHGERGLPASRVFLLVKVNVAALRQQWYQLCDSVLLVLIIHLFSEHEVAKQLNLASSWLDGHTVPQDDGCSSIRDVSDVAVLA